MQSKLSICRGLYIPTKYLQKTNKFSFKYSHKLFSTLDNDDSDNITDDEVQLGKPLTFSYDNLPDETMYIIDGTSWLFNAYHR